MKNILVTGGGGYVGTVLSQRLSKKGYVVKVLDNFMFGDHLDGVEGIVRFKGDIRDKNLVTQALKNTDCVIHLAAISNDPCSELDPELTRQVNYEASKFLIKRSKEMGIER
ncbi:MAG: SDR family NAD-dependent epimerase/dehydratase, partial [Deltaproteobacteria bacterium]